MSDTFYIKQHNTLDPLRVHLLDADRQPVTANFTGAACTFLMRTSGDNTAVLTGTATLIHNLDGSWDAEYDWVSGDTAHSGIFYGEFRIVMIGGAQKSFPDPGVIMIVITPAIGG